MAARGWAHGSSRYRRVGFVAFVRSGSTARSRGEGGSNRVAAVHLTRGQHQYRLGEHGRRADRVGGLPGEPWAGRGDKHGPNHVRLRREILRRSLLRMCRAGPRRSRGAVELAVGRSRPGPGRLLGGWTAVRGHPRRGIVGHRRARPNRSGRGTRQPARGARADMDLRIRSGDPCRRQARVGQQSSRRGRVGLAGVRLH